MSLSPKSLSSKKASLRSSTASSKDELLLKKLSETSLLLEVLAQVNSLMSKGKSFELFFIEVGNILKEKLNFKYIQIWVRDDRNPNLLRLVTPESAGEFRTASLSTGIVGKALREAKTICVPDVHKNPDYTNIHPEVTSELCVPLIDNGVVLGALNIETDTPQTFEHQIPIIEVIAENLSHSMKLALLYKTHEHFYGLVEQMTEGVWVGDSEEKTLYTNPTAQKMLEYTEEEFLQMKSFDFFDEESKKNLAQEIEKRKRGVAGRYEAVFVSKTGKKIPVFIQASPFENGGSMATFTDLRELKTTEKKLANVEHYLGSIIQHSQEAIVGFDKEARVQSWNVGAERMFGYKAFEMIGSDTKRLIPPERLQKGEWDQVYQEIMTKGFVKNFETIRVHKNGQQLAVSLTFSLLKDEEGKILGISGIYRDITAQKKWEHELQDRFEKMQDAYREMGKQRRHLDYLIDILNMATSNEYNASQIATFIVNALIMITKVDGITLRRFEPDTGKLVLAAQSGLGEEWWGKKYVPFEGSIVQAAIEHGGPLKILDIVTHPRYTSPGLARRNNLRSALVIPLVVGDEILGSLSLYLSLEANLSLLDDEFISVFAKQASLALKLAK